MGGSSGKSNSHLNFAASFEIEYRAFSCFHTVEKREGVGPWWAISVGPGL